ncbi:MAG: glycosyltransferase family 9 protein [Elusimicrobiota bacterium]|jgi:ADP-heptose:LPS heptosyltransferase|nr:glycosyltransferase family 9 protein [Elusimicrobiota bacterium]
MNLNGAIRQLKSSIAKLIFDKKRRILKPYYISKIDNNTALNLSSVNTILFLRDDDKIGDMVVSTLTFREIKQKYPNIKILLLCAKNNKEIVKYNPYIDEIIEIKSKFFADFFTYMRLGSRKIDIAVDLFEFAPKPLHLLFLRLINPKFLIGLYKSEYNTYDFSIEEYFFDKHIVKRHLYLLKMFDIKAADINYDIFLSDKEQNEAKIYIDKADGKYKIVINPFAASKHRTFQYEKLKNLIYEIKKIKDCSIFILCPHGKFEKIKNIQNDKERIFIFQGKSILSAAALIKECDMIISPDTSIVHIASAFKKKTIALYLDFSNRAEKTDIIWGPNNPNAVIINADTKNGKLENDIKNIDSQLIIKKLKEIS